MTSNDVRRKLTAALTLDLVGPHPDSELADETLSQAPSRWYLTGFLVPTEGQEAQRVDETADEEIDKNAEGGGGDDATTPDAGASRRAYFPSSVGVSVLVPKGAKRLTVTVYWGDYRPIFDDLPEEEADNPAAIPLVKEWRRTPRTESFDSPSATANGSPCKRRRSRPR